MRVFVSKNLMFLLILLMLIQPVQAQAYSEWHDDALVCMEATQKFEKEYKIKKHLLTTISSVETGRWNEAKQQNLAWPWTINAQGKGRFFNSKAEAVAEVKRLQKAGVKSIDVGCMQINLAYHPDAFKSVEEAFDPNKNVEYSAKFLKNLYETRDNDWIKAAMAYHSSVPHKAQKYKMKLVSAFEKVKMAQNDVSEKLFGNTTVKGNVAQTKVKKLATESVYAKNKKEIERTVAQKANSWREAKLAEYRKNKLR